jgi:hypothetical protein
LKLLVQDEEVDHQSQKQQATYYLEPCFAVVQGHRFVWWETVQDFDNGEVPAGKLFLSGHAGLGGPSPLEMRALSKDELPFCLSIFGRGSTGQQRITMILPDEITKQRLEDAISETTSLKND